MKQEDVVREYFQAWLDKNIEPLKCIFTDDVLYSECYGPEYRGLSQILKWFIDWNKCGTVLRWEIKRFIHQNLVTVVEWYFECEYNNEIGGFDGVSIIEFDKNMRIMSIKEFESKTEHSYPYE